MNLHRVESADWDDVAPDQRTVWQRWGARSHGVLTPANCITMLGLVLVIISLYIIVDGHWLAGIITLFLGRLADVLDGLVADATQTKNFFGEGLDVVIDKTALGLTLIAFIGVGIIPWWAGTFMALQAGYNTVIGILASSRHFKLHPTRSGKLANVFLWLSVGLYVAAAERYGAPHIPYSMVAAHLVFGVFAVFALISSWEYSRYFWSRRRAA